MLIGCPLPLYFNRTHIDPPMNDIKKKFRDFGILELKLICEILNYLFLGLSKYICIFFVSFSFSQMIDLSENISKSVCITGNLKHPSNYSN